MLALSGSREDVDTMTVRVESLSRHALNAKGRSPMKTRHGHSRDETSHVNGIMGRYDTTSDDIGDR
jgi:hypothetical protein